MIENLWKKVQSASFIGIPLLILYFIIRTFSQFEYFCLTADQCSFLSVARTFPFHKLYNNELFLIHPPLYGFVVGILSYIMPLFDAGLAVSILFGILNFLLLRKMTKMFSLNAAGTMVALLYLTLNVTSISMESQVSRISILVFFMGMAICSFHEYILTRERKFLYRTCLFNALSLLCSDQALLLLLAQAIQFLMYADLQRMWKEFAKIMAVSILAYSIWPLIRIYIYLTNSDYPAGIDGTIEFFSGFNLLEVLQPNNLPMTKYYRSFYTSTSFSISSLNLDKSLLVPATLVFIPRGMALFIIGILMLSAVTLGILKKDKSVLLLALLSVILLMPCIFGMYFWYGLPFIVPFSLLLGKAVHFLTERFNLNSRVMLASEIAIVVLLSGSWLSSYNPAKVNTVFRPAGGKNFLFTRKPVARGQSTIKNLPEGKDICFIAPIGLVNESIYLSGRKFIALPYYYELLDVIIRRYDVKYVWFSSEQLLRFTDEKGNFISGRDVIRKIISNPEKFEKVGEWLDPYPDCYQPETFFLYRVKSEQ
ncbi:MAG TPA: hypothetical protein DCZ94_14795 [Lentisphaeria bacterium]|nr:MAG: hypothetical protein A2X48_02950 [Lentisphaerae bacterium GWF2_49_21]HBC88216.1 hypothetical protein [Lentisphaeria bacterium]